MKIRTILRPLHLLFLSVLVLTGGLCYMLYLDSKELTALRTQLA